MFSKSKVSQSMIDAVNKVLGEEPVEQKDQLLSETAPLKEPTSTGMRVYGGSYGNSAKAKKDQTKSPVDNLKGPKDKEMKEELKGNQDKIDANHNDKIDSQDFKILRGKKKVKEETTFASKLMDKVKSSITEKKDVVMPEEVRKSDVPAYLRKAKGDTPLTVADVKGPKKDTISAPENLAKNKNEMYQEEVELSEGVEVKKEYDDKKEAEHGVYHNGKKIGYVVHDKKHDIHTAYHNPSSYDEKGHADDYSQIDDFHKPHHAIAQIKASAGINEEIELDEDGPGRKWRQGPPLLKSRAVGSARYGTDAEAKYPDEKRTWVARGYEGDQ
jgi:hypothetical protein